MISHLRQRLARLLAETETVTLATSGEAGTLASTVPARAVDHRLYLLLLSTSDHLFNIEKNPLVALSTPIWEMQGRARVLQDSGENGAGMRARSGGWGIVVEVSPQRVQVRASDGWGYSETLDVETQSKGGSREDQLSSK